ncbi:MAG: methyltransferase domain-containing protein [Deltaproteobacteria bacterium]|nr:methyltransferase domain-containing protein [Deltaproteobacteria bacterium]
MTTEANREILGWMEGSAPPVNDKIFMALLEDVQAKEFFIELDGLLLKRFVEQERGTTLQLGCATPNLTDGLMRKISGMGKLVVIDPRLPLLDAVRFQMGGKYPGRVFFKSDLKWRRLPFDDEVFNTVISNLFWDETDDRDALLLELYRVLQPGGSLLLTLYLEDSFHEFYDLFSETITKFDLLHLAPAVQASESSHPPEEQLLKALEDSGFSLCRATGVDTSVRFAGSKEFVTSALYQTLWLPAWSEIGGEETERILWHMREAMDRYFADRSLGMTVRVGVLSGIK